MAIFSFEVQPEALASGCDVILGLSYQPSTYGWNGRSSSAMVQLQSWGGELHWSWIPLVCLGKMENNHIALIKNDRNQKEWPFCHTTSGMLAFPLEAREFDKTTAWPVGKNQVNHTIPFQSTTSLSHCMQWCCWYTMLPPSHSIPWESPVTNVLDPRKVLGGLQKPEADSAQPAESLQL